MKEKNQWYADTLKEKDIVVNQLNNDVAGLATDNDDLKDECDRMRDELAALAEQAQGSERSRREPSASLSPYSKAHTRGLLPLPNRRHVGRSESRSEVGRRTRREATAATNNSNASHASVNLDPDSGKAIQVDRSVKDPDKFEGKTGTFYP
jgi:cell division septum initiation protein DivIVA